MVHIMRHLSSLFLLLFCLNVHAVTAKSYLVTDTQGQVVIEKDADQPRPIASITKLMTIMVVLDSRQPLDDVIILDYKLTRQYHTHLPHSVKTLTRQDLIDLAMVKSDNFAAYTLCANYPGGVDSCIDAMNLKAINLGMTSTHYTDPTGLEETNISTARDLIKLIISAKSYPNIVSATRPSVEIKVKKHWYQAFNTSPIVRLHDDDIIVSKTGYIHQSGGCLVMLMNTQLGQRIIALLGSRNAHTRFLEAEELIKS